MSRPCGYRLSLQTVLPDDYTRDGSFSALLALLRESGFWGVELNIGDPCRHDFSAVCAHLRMFGLEFSMLASGLTARREGLSLSHEDENVRRRSVARVREMIEWIGQPETGLIMGLIKGGVSTDPDAARARFVRSLSEIAPSAGSRGVPLLVEATNRYETVVGNSLDATVALVAASGSDHAQVLPDTFHMNIEEDDMLGALTRHVGRYSSLHLSDNNRLFPGLGAIDFGRIFGFLRQVDYRGRIAIEGNTRGDLLQDLRASAQYLGHLDATQLETLP